MGLLCYNECNMRLKLSKVEHFELIHLSRTGMRDNQLCILFRISRSTVERYKHDYLRELSREVQRRKKYIVNKQCHRCDKPFAGHPRCVSCEILIHGKDKTCDSYYCIDTIR